MTKEMLQKAKECKSVEEAEKNSSKLHGEGEITDDALNNVSGGTAIYNSNDNSDDENKSDTENRKPRFI